MAASGGQRGLELVVWGRGDSVLSSLLVCLHGSFSLFPTVSSPSLSRSRVNALAARQASIRVLMVCVVATVIKVIITLLLL